MTFAGTVARFTFRHEAEFAKGYLDDAGVESVLLADDAGGNLGLALENEVTLVVAAENVARAREILVNAGVIEA